MNLTITPSAAAKVAALLVDHPDEKAMRIFVQGGGCAGFSYGFAFESEIAEDDFVIEQDGVKFVVDSMSSQYLQEAQIDWIEDLMGSSFQINNPNAKTTCGCGSSFSA